MVPILRFDADDPRSRRTGHTLNDRRSDLCDEYQHNHSDLKAVIVNTSLKRQAGKSHTDLLLGVVAEMMERNGVAVSRLHMLDHRIAYGVQPDMTEHGWDRDDWPTLWKTVKAADGLIVGTPIWLGEESSLCRLLIERLNAQSGEPNDRG